MKRKTALKKNNSERHSILMKLREEKNPLKQIITKNGENIYLNLHKHFYLKQSYKNEEYNKEIFREFHEHVN